MILSNWLAALPKKVRRNRQRSKALSRRQGSIAVEQFEPRTLLTASPFDGGYAGTFIGSVNVFGTPETIPGDISDNTFGVSITSGVASVFVPTISGYGTGTVDGGGSVSVTTSGNLFGTDTSVTYAGTLQNVGGNITGSGTWTATGDGITGSGTWTFEEATALDFGDAPSPYPTLLADGGARHTIIPGFHLGSVVDSEADGLPSTFADGDGNDGLFDEEGVSFPDHVYASRDTMITVSAASAGGVLSAWVDFNGDGDWSDAGEQIFTDQSLSAGYQALHFAVPDSATLGATFARFRYSTISGLGPTGPAQDGEVEDYRIQIEPTPPPAGAVIANGTFHTDNTRDEGTTGTIALGVNSLGELNMFPDTPFPSSSGTQPVGLRYLATGAEATAPGCLCEGWGMADAVTGISGFRNQANENSTNLSLVSFTVTDTNSDGQNDTAVSVVDILDGSGNPFMRVTQNYHPSPATRFLYQVDVTVENLTNSEIGDIRYRRVMDWDIEPTAFSEYSTIQGSGVVLPDGTHPVLFTSDDGFATSNPLGGTSSINNTGDFVDSGPADHGALFDFGLGSLAAHANNTIRIFYGAAGTEVDALNALSAVNAQVYSLGEPSTADGPTLGTPNTFIFGFSSFHVDNVNHNPVADDETIDGNFNAPTTVTTATLLSGDTDPDFDTVFVSGVSATSAHGGSVSLNSDTGVITYTPLTGFAGDDTFTYTISDGAGGTATGTVTVHIEAPATGEIHGIKWNDLNGNGIRDTTGATESGVTTTAGSGAVSLATVDAALAPSDPVSFDVSVTVPASSTGSVDVALLQDLTGSFGDDLATVRGLVPTIMSTIASSYANSEFGVTSFKDKPPPFPGSAGDYVFNLDQALTTDQTLVQNTVNALIANGGNDLPESQLDGLLMLANHSADVGFRGGAAHVVLVATDAAYHFAGDGSAPSGTPANNGDGVADGSPPGTGEDYASVAQVKSALLSAGIVPVFMVTSDVFSTYQDLVTQLGFGTVVTLSSDSSNIVTAITNGLTSALTNVQLVAQGDTAGYVTSITPAEHDGVTPGSTVTFTVTLSSSAPAGDETFHLVSPGFGSVEVHVGTGTEEPPLAGWTIFLDTNHDGMLDDGEVSDMTDANGQYDFTGLAAGSYDIREVQQAGWVQTYPGSEGGLHHVVSLDPSEVINSVNITNPADENNVNFGNQQATSEIHGIKWNDLNGNGVRDTTGVSESTIVSTTPGTGSVSLASVDAALAVGDPLSFDVNVTVPGGTGGTGALDVVLLQDLTGSFFDDIATVRTVMPDIISGVRATYSDSNFGVTSFKDKPPPFPGGFGDFVYHLDQSLTSDGSAVQTAVNGLSTGGGGDGPEDSLDGLLDLAQDASVGFRGGASHVVLVATDAAFHVAGDGSAPSGTSANNGDGVADSGEDYPSVAQVKSALLSAGIVPVFMVTSDQLSTYQNLVTQLGFGTVVELTSNSSNIVTAVTSGLSAALSNVLLVAQGDTAGLVTSITPAEHDGVSPGSTVTFHVTLSASATADETFHLVSPGFGTIDVHASTGTSEPPLAGWTIFLDTNHDGMLDDGEVSDMTDANGQYDFTGLAAGSYDIREVQQAGWVQTYPGSEGGLHHVVSLDPSEVINSVNITNPADENNVNFGNLHQAGEIHGQKWNDLDGDGVRDAAGTGSSTLPDITLAPMGPVILTRNDDGSTGLLPLGFTFQFFGNSYTDFYINNNGNITFTEPLRAFTASGFPQDLPIVAPFWADVDTRNLASGEVHLTQGTNERGHSFIQVDWPDVGYYNSQADKFNDFTLYIEGDPAGDVVAFFYRNMEWTTGSASGGSGGFGGTGAQIGFDSGDGSHFISLGRPSDSDALAPFRDTHYEFRIDASGVPQSGEDGVDGFTIELLDSLNNVVATTTTHDEDVNGDGFIDPNTERGLYEFVGLPLGDYTVREVVPTGWVQTSPDPGTYTINITDEHLVSSGNDFGNHAVTEIPVNDPPSFEAGDDQVVLEDSGYHTAEGWATDITPGPADESDQLVDFIVLTDNDALFSVLPSISPDGTLTYTVAPDASGVATVTVRLHDNGGTDNEGVDVSEPQTFTITVVPVNDAPCFVTATDRWTTIEDYAPIDLPGFVQAAHAGPEDESDQVLNWVISTDNDSLFSELPTISEDGTLSYTPAPDAFGTAHVTIQLHDNGGIENDGVDTSEPQFLTITVLSSNDAPSFEAGDNIIALNDGEVHTFEEWATDISAGPADESGQSINFIVNTDNNALFKVKPAIAVDGTLTFTPVLGAVGTALVTVRAHDNGGTSCYGDNTSDTQTFIITIRGINHAPTFTAGSNQVVAEDSGLITATGWATGIIAGPPTESDQTINFLVSTNNDSLFSVLPTVSEDGTLTFAAAPNANGSATVTIRAHDDGGTDFGGIDTSNPQTFTITVNSVNDVPTFTAGPDHTVLEDAGAQTIANWATGLGVGPANESSQTLSFFVSTNNDALFSVLPTIAADGTLTYTPAADANGSAIITVQAHDDGGLDFGGVDTSAPQTFMINVTPVNDAPSFAKGPDLTKPSDGAAKSFSHWATNIKPTPANESSDVIDFVVTTAAISPATNASLFTTLPAVSADGTLTYTPKKGAAGSATVTVKAHDNGGTLNGGHDTSELQTFTITLTGLNHAPTLTIGGAQTVNEDSGTKTVTGFASADPKDPGQTIHYIVTVDKPALFSVQPTISADGTLSFCTAADANGAAKVTVKAQDDGGTDGGGKDTSAPKTFNIVINAVNDAPSFVKGADETVREDAAAIKRTGWATGITLGPSNESTQKVKKFDVTNDNNDLFEVQPTVTFDSKTKTGTLTYKVAANHSGSATVTVKVQDDGGTANGGVDTSAPQTFTINVTPVNDAPSFTVGDDLSVNQDAGPQTISDFLTDISAGPGEPTQHVHFTVTTDVGSLFSAAPAIDDEGTLTFTPSPTGQGTANVTVRAQDDGGTADGGVDASTATFHITVKTVITLSIDGVVIVSRVGNIMTVKHGASATDTSTGTGANLIVPDINVEKVGELNLIGGANGDTVILHSSMNSSGSSSSNRFTGSIIVNGNAGNDVLDAHNIKGIGVTFLGGDGNDTASGGEGNDLFFGNAGDDSLLGLKGNDFLQGGDGNDILDGGDGIDVLEGGDGRDLLIGGLKADTLNGNAGDDILIGGTSTLNAAGINAVMAEWTSANSYADRVSHITTGGGGANGSTKLTSSTVKNDSGAADNISGNEDTDWFFKSASDVLVDALSGETKTTI